MERVKNWFKSFIYRYFEVIEVDEDGNEKVMNSK